MLHNLDEQTNKPSTFEQNPTITYKFIHLLKNPINIPLQCINTWHHNLPRQLHQQGHHFPEVAQLGLDLLRRLRDFLDGVDCVFELCDCGAEGGSGFFEGLGGGFERLLENMVLL